MSDKVKLIKEEIERRIKDYQSRLAKWSNSEYTGRCQEDKELLKFINSLSEESGCEVNFTTKNEDLEEASISYSCANPSERSDGMYDQTDIEWAFEAGAEWYENKMKETLKTEYEKGRFDMREEMIKNAVLETKVMMDCDGDGIETPYEEWLTLEDTEIPYIPDNLGLKEGDKVKVLILKPE